MAVAAAAVRRLRVGHEVVALARPAELLVEEDADPLPTHRYRRHEHERRVSLRQDAYGRAPGAPAIVRARGREIAATTVRASSLPSDLELAGRRLRRRGQPECGTGTRDVA